MSEGKNFSGQTSWGTDLQINFNKNHIFINHQHNYLMIMTLIIINFFFSCFKGNDHTFYFFFDRHKFGIQSRLRLNSLACWIWPTGHMLIVTAIHPHLGGGGIVIMIFSIIFLLLQTFVNCMIMMLLYSVRLLILTGSARW